MGSAKIPKNFLVQKQEFSGFLRKKSSTKTSRFSGQNQ